MADESGTTTIGTAAIDIKVNTASMQASIDAAKGKMSSLGAEAQAQYDKATAAQKRNATSLLNQINVLGKTRAEQLAYNAQLRVGGTLGDALAAKALAAGAAMKVQASSTAMASKEMEHFSLNNSFARRELGRLVNDLANGNYGRLQQTTLTLANASGLLGKVFSLTGLAIVGVAAAAGSLLLAWRQGENEINAYNAALVKTGGYAGVTSKQLDDMAASMDSVRGTQHAAAEALAKTVSAGVFTGDQIRAVASAVEVAGSDADQMVNAFAKIAGDPVNAIVELNKQQHFLTDATYEQIKALQEQGDTQAAATLAIQTYANTVISRADDIKEKLDNVSQAWGGVKSAAAEAWDAMIHGTRDSANSAIQEIKDWWSGLHSLAGFIAHPMQSAFQAQAAPAAASDADHSAATKSLNQQANETLIDFGQEQQKFQSAEDKRVASIVSIVGRANAAIAKANAAGNKTLAAQIAKGEEQLIAAINAQATPHATAKPPVDNTAKLRQMALDDFQKEIDAQGKLDDAQKKATASDAAYNDQLQQGLATRKEQIDLQIMSVGMGKQEYQRQSELLQVYSDFDRKLAQLNKERDRGSISTDQYNTRLKELKQTETDTVNAVVGGYKRMDAAQADWRNGLLAGMNDLIEQGKSVAGMVEGTFSDAFNGMNDALANFVTTGKLDFADLANSIIQDLVKMELRIAESQILQSILGAYTGTSTGTMATSFDSNGTFFSFAKGGVFDSPSLSQYSGGVYDSPHLFKFASGGVFGEAGPEAVMPLSRGPDGKLGVKSQGMGVGNTTVIIENHSDSQAKVQQSKDGNGNDIIKVIVGQAVNEVNKQIGRNGSTAQVLQQTFGLSRRGVPVGG